MFIYAIIFLVASIIVGIFDVKKRKLVGFNKIKTVLLYLLFGISMSVFCSFITINFWISIFIFLLWSLVIVSFPNKYNDYLFTRADLIIVSIIGIILCVYNMLNLEYSKLLYIILGIGIYLLPLLGYCDRKSYMSKKVERCSKLVDAEIIKLIKNRKNLMRRNRYSINIDSSGISIIRYNIYVPQVKFFLNEKGYKVFNPSEIFLWIWEDDPEKITVGDTIKIFVNPDCKNFNNPYGDNEIWFPATHPYNEFGFNFGIALFYISTLAIFALIVFLNFMN